MQYGKFEGVSSRRAGPDVVIWTARPTGTSSAPNYTIKVVSFGGSAFGFSAEDQANSFVRRAKVQQAAAERSAFWAPVHDTGTHERKAYSVVDHYSFSLQELIEARIHAETDTLFAVSEAVLFGLRDLRDTMGLTHGELTPARIWCSGKQIRRGRVFLAEPRDDLPFRSDRYNCDDLRVLGEVIYALVHARPLPAGEMIPLHRTSAWKRLGSQEDQWFSLCNILLETGPNSSDVSSSSVDPLDRAIKLLTDLEPRSSSKLKWALSAAALLAIGTAGAGMAYLRPASDATVTNVSVGSAKPINPLLGPNDLVRLAEQVAASKHPPLATFSQYIANQIRDGGDDARDEHLLKLAQELLLEITTDDPARQKDWASLDTDSKSSLSSTTPNEVMFRDWLDLAKSYYRPSSADPRIATEAWRKSLARTAESIAVLSKVAPDDALIFSERGASAMASVTRLDETALIPWIVKNEANIRDQSKRCEQLAKSLESDVATKLASAVEEWTYSSVNRFALAIDNSSLDLDKVVIAWSIHLDRACEQVKKNPALIAIVDERLKGEHKAINAALQLLRLPSELTVENGMTWRADAKKLAKKHCEIAILDCAEKVAESDVKAADTLVKAYANWSGSLSKTIADVERLDAMTRDIRSGRAPENSDFPANQLRAAADSIKSMSDANVTEVFEPTLAAARPVVQIWSTPIEHTNELQAIASDKDRPAIDAVAAWVRLGEHDRWPATVAQVRAEHEITMRLRSLEDAPATLAEEAKRRWERWLNTLSSSEDIESAVDLYEVAVSQKLLDFDTQPMWFQWNVMVAELKDRPLASDKDVEQLLDESSNVLQALASDARVDHVRVRLGSFISDVKSGAVTSSHRGGPGEVGLKSDLSREGEGYVVYKWPLEDGMTLSIEFRRIVPTEPSTPPFYISTSEVSVQLMMEVVNLYREQFKPMLEKANDLSNTRVQTWAWRSGRFDCNLGEGGKAWVTATEMGSPPTSNTSQYPVQCISPEAAMLAAALLGCRLPTTGEWTAASILRPDDAEKSPTMNLRDRTFNDQQSGRSGRFRIDAEIFVPESRRGERIDSADFWLSNKVLGAGSGTYDDGEGFLSKVGPRGGPDLPLYSGMYDLVGNVAEYVFEQSDALDELPFAPKLDAFDRAAGAKKLGDAVRQVADIQRLSLRVAGASAFSPSKYGLTTAHALKLEQSQVGFSDVGFRLAYTDPLTPVIVRRTQKLIGALTYMTAADAPATATGGQNTQRPTGG